MALRNRSAVALLVSLALAYSVSAVTAAPTDSTKSAYSDRALASNDGKKWIIRTVLLPDFNGGDVTVEMKLYQDGKGGLVYRYEDQSEATKIYHQATCEAGNTVAAREGETVLSGEGTISGWACKDDPQSTDKVIKFGSDQVGVDQGSISPRASFFVTAFAPRGIIPIGVNFRAEGVSRYQSSVAGKSSAALAVDNGRCSVSRSDDHPAPFSGGDQIWVNCIGVRKGVMPTAMTACIPRNCVTDRGTYNVF